MKFKKKWIIHFINGILNVTNTYSVMDDSFSLMGFLAFKHYLVFAFKKKKHYLVFTCVTFYCLDWVKRACMFIYKHMKVIDVFISRYLCSDIYVSYKFCL